MHGAGAGRAAPSRRAVRPHVRAAACAARYVVVFLQRASRVTPVTCQLPPGASPLRQPAPAAAAHFPLEALSRAPPG